MYIAISINLADAGNVVFLYSQEIVRFNLIDTKLNGVSDHLVFLRFLLLSWVYVPNWNAIGLVRPFPASLPDVYR